MIRSLGLLALVLSAACSSSEAKPGAAPSATAADHQACVDVSVRSRVCSEPFVAGLVDTRAKLDLPAGIAAAVRADRNAVIAQARGEWAHDSTDAAIDATCKRPEATAIAATHDCLKRPDCAGFVACVMPSLEAQLQRVANQTHK